MFEDFMLYVVGALIALAVFKDEILDYLSSQTITRFKPKNTYYLNPDTGNLDKIKLVEITDMLDGVALADVTFQSGGRKELSDHNLAFSWSLLKPGRFHSKVIMHGQNRWNVDELAELKVANKALREENAIVNLGVLDHTRVIFKNVGEAVGDVNKVKIQPEIKKLKLEEQAQPTGESNGTGESN